MRIRPPPHAEGRPTLYQFKHLHFSLAPVREALSTRTLRSLPGHNMNTSETVDSGYREGTRGHDTLQLTVQKRARPNFSSFIARALGARDA